MQEDNEPELEFGEAANEGTKLVVYGGGECGALTVENLGVHLRGEEPDQKVEDVYSQTVRH